MKKLRRHWLPLLVVTVSVLGMPLGYLTGRSLAQLENKNLANSRFLVQPAEAEAFSRILVSGGGVVVRFKCAREFDIQVEEHPDDLYLIQRQKKKLFISGQQLTSTEPFRVLIHSPEKLVHIDVRNGAKMEVAPCAVGQTQLTVNLAAGAKLAISGMVSDLFLFLATGSELLPGPEGYLTVDRALVDLVFGSTAHLCGVYGEVRGSSAVKSKVIVGLDTRVTELHPGVVDRSCPVVKEELTT